MAEQRSEEDGSPAPFRRGTALDRLPADRPALGTWIKLPAIESVELAAVAGLDSIVIDLEHSTLSLETAATMIAVSLGRGLLPLVRVPDHSPAWIQRCLDAGAAGVVVPHVDSLEQAQAVHRAAHFPPIGHRGVGPTSRAGSWSLEPMADYLAQDSAVVVVAQIESPAGVESVDAILREGLADALLVGAADLSVALGLPPDDPAVEATMLDVLDRCRAAGVPCAIAVGADGTRAAALWKRGFRLVIAGNDATILGTGLRSIVTAAGSA